MRSRVFRYPSTGGELAAQMPRRPDRRCRSGPFCPGPADLVFEKDNGDLVTIAATVTGVRSVARSELTDET